MAYCGGGPVENVCYGHCPLPTAHYHYDYRLLPTHSPRPLRLLIVLRLQPTIVTPADCSPTTVDYHCAY